MVGCVLPGKKRNRVLCRDLDRSYVLANLPVVVQTISAPCKYSITQVKPLRDESIILGSSVPRSVCNWASGPACTIVARVKHIIMHSVSCFLQLEYPMFSCATMGTMLYWKLVIGGAHKLVRGACSELVAFYPEVEGCGGVG